MTWTLRRGPSAEGNVTPAHMLRLPSVCQVLRSTGLFQEAAAPVCLPMNGCSKVQPEFFAHHAACAGKSAFDPSC
jgi:hypothetical protein